MDAVHITLNLKSLNERYYFPSMIITTFYLLAIDINFGNGILSIFI
jgi:hypothetical protein